MTDIDIDFTALSAAWPPVVERDDGSLLVIAGKYLVGKREYAYATLHVAGLGPSTVGPAIARPLITLKGEQIAEFLRLDATWSGKDDRVTIWWIATGVPVRVKAGQTYVSSGNIHYGDAQVTFYGGPSNASAYRSQSKQFIAAHAADLAAPQPPTPNQVQTLQKFLDLATSWGISAGLQMPATKSAAKTILDALAENGWKLRGNNPDPVYVWRTVSGVPPAPPKISGRPKGPKVLDVW